MFQQVGGGGSPRHPHLRTDAQIENTTFPQTTYAIGEKW